MSGPRSSAAWSRTSTAWACGSAASAAAASASGRSLRRSTMSGTGSIRIGRAAGRRRARRSRERRRVTAWLRRRETTGRCGSIPGRDEARVFVAGSRRDAGRERAAAMAANRGTGRGGGGSGCSWRTSSRRYGRRGSRVGLARAPHRHRRSIRTVAGHGVPWRVGDPQGIGEGLCASPSLRSSRGNRDPPRRLRAMAGSPAGSRHCGPLGESVATGGHEQAKASQVSRPRGRPHRDSGERQTAKMHSNEPVNIAASGPRTHRSTPTPKLNVPPGETNDVIRNVVTLAPSLDSCNSHLAVRSTDDPCSRAGRPVEGLRWRPRPPSASACP